jgi:hypothetical protein
MTQPSLSTSPLLERSRHTSKTFQIDKDIHVKFDISKLSDAL